MCNHINFRLNNEYEIECNDCGYKANIGMHSSNILMKKVIEQEERIKRLEKVIKRLTFDIAE